MSQIALETDRRAGKPAPAWLSRLLADRLALVGLLLLLPIVALTLFGPLLIPYGPDTMDYMAMLHPPSAAHWFGTDDLGRDDLVRTLVGGRLSLSVGLGAVALAVAGGVPLGLISGYAGGWIDEALMRLVDSVMALPPLVLALTITAVLGPGLINAMLAIGIVSIPTFTRLVRGQVIVVKQHEFIAAAISVGVHPLRVILRHILPNTIGPVIVQAALGIGFAIITESSVSFIGLGAQPPTATWGSMVQVGFQYLQTAPWLTLAPAVTIFVAVLAFTMLAEGLRGLLDPASRTHA